MKTTTTVQIDIITEEGIEGFRFGLYPPQLAHADHQAPWLLLRKTLAEDLPRRVAQFGPCAVQHDTHDMPDKAAMRGKMKALLRQGTSPAVKAHNDAILDCLNLLSKS